MEIVEKLRALNPDIALYSVFDPEFAPYGQILSVDGTDEFCRILGTQPIPETGNCYKASVTELEQTSFIQNVQCLAFGDMDIQAGYCNGNGHLLNSLEYHKCSEVNLTTTGLVLLLALPADLHDGHLDSSCVKGFYLPPSVPVEIFPRVLHFAPCRVQSAGFICLVVLEKGVNSPLASVDTSADGERKLLWMRGKWMTSHPESPQAKLGAFLGISGKNLDLQIE